MSIETLLTLGLTAVILIVAFVIRLVVLTILRIGLHLAGRDASWLKPGRVATPRTPLRPRLAAAGRRAVAGWAYVRASVASAGWKTAAGAAYLRPRVVSARRKTAAGFAFLRPRVVSAGRKTAAALAFLAALLAAGAASVGRAAAVGAAGLERWADATNRRLAPRTMKASATLRRALRAAGRRIAPILVTIVATVQHVATLALARGRPRGKHSISPRSTADEPTRIIDLDGDDESIAPRTKRPPAGVRL